MSENYQIHNEDVLNTEDILLLEGKEITLDEIFNTTNPEPITVDKDNVIQGGVVSYLLAIKNGKKKVSVIRTNKLQKIKIGLSSAA
jgi:ribosomal protein L21